MDKIIENVYNNFYGSIKDTYNDAKKKIHQSNMMMLKIGLLKIILEKQILEVIIVSLQVNLKRSSKSIYVF